MSKRIHLRILLVYKALNGLIHNRMNGSSGSIQTPQVTCRTNFLNTSKLTKTFIFLKSDQTLLFWLSYEYIAFISTRIAAFKMFHHCVYTVFLTSILMMRRFYFFVLDVKFFCACAKHEATINLPCLVTFNRIIYSTAVKSNPNVPPTARQTKKREVLFEVHLSFVAESCSHLPKTNKQTQNPGKA